MEVALRLRNQFGAKPRQLRVDGVVCQIPKKHAKRLLEWREEAWPTGNKRFRPAGARQPHHNRRRQLQPRVRRREGAGAGRAVGR